MDGFISFRNERELASMSVISLETSAINILLLLECVNLPLFYLREWRRAAPVFFVVSRMNSRVSCTKH